MKGYLLIVLFVVLLFTFVYKSDKMDKNEFFEKAFKLVFGNEILSNDPSKITLDSGGLTKYGISDLADGIADGKYFGVDIRTLTVAKTKEIYYNEYFKPYAAFFTAYPNLALSLFDMSINSGVDRARQLFGEITKSKTTVEQLAVVKKYGDRKAVEAYNERRKQFYESLIKKNPTKYAKYENSWLNRLKIKFA